jgi:hypothetical protein
MSRQQLLLFVIACGLIALAVTLFPVSYRITRLIWLAALAGCWLGLIALLWRRRWLCAALVAAPLLFIGFALLPIGHQPAQDELRGAYLGGLRRYEGVRYVWGGESPRGIDCSGLVRRGMIDSNIRLGMRQGSPLALRRAAFLWWLDCTAQALGDPATGWTQPVIEARSINELPPDRLQPGDLALVGNGTHIMAYLGDQAWIEADPEKQRVLIMHVPANSQWFTMPAKVVRWCVLDGR